MSRDRGKGQRLHNKHSERVTISRSLPRETLGDLELLEHDLLRGRCYHRGIQQAELHPMVEKSSPEPTLAHFSFN